MIEIVQVQLGVTIGGCFVIYTVATFSNGEDATKFTQWIDETYPGEFDHQYVEVERVNELELFKEVVSELARFVKENNK